MDSIWEVLQLPAIQRSAVALAVAAVGLAIVGVFVVGLDIITARFAFMHLALLGIAIGLLVGLNPYVCALVLCAAAGAALAPLARRTGGLSGPMGFLMTIAIALALLVLSVSGVNATGAFELLWGSIFATRTSDIVVLIALTAVVLALYLFRRAELGLLLFDREVALTSGVNVDRLTVVLLILVAVAIGAAIRLTGALLVDAVTLLPALAARNLGRSFPSMVGWAVALGLFTNGVGLALALALDQPPGPVLVLVGGTVTLVTFLVPESNCFEGSGI